MIVPPGSPAAAVLQRLRAASDPVRAEHDRAYLRSGASVEHWGVSVPAVRSAVRAAGTPSARADLLVLAEQLWGTEVYDARLAAAVALDRWAGLLLPDDLEWLEGLLREAGTWALVDLLAPRPLAAIDGVDTEVLTATLDRWVTDPLVWLRRSVLLAHLIDLRHGLAGWERFIGYADRLVADREFFVRKALGWVLRDTARHDPALVYDWVLPRAARLSGVSIREAVRYFSPEQRAGVLDRHAGG